MNSRSETLTAFVAGCPHVEEVFVAVAAPPASRHPHGQREHRLPVIPRLDSHRHTGSAQGDAAESYPDVPSASTTPYSFTRTSLHPSQRLKV